MFIEALSIKDSKENVFCKSPQTANPLPINQFIGTQIKFIEDIDHYLKPWQTPHKICKDKRFEKPRLSLIRKSFKNTSEKNKQPIVDDERVLNNTLPEPENVSINAKN